MDTIRIDANQKNVRDPLTELYNKAGAREFVTESCKTGGGLLMILDLPLYGALLAKTAEISYVSVPIANRE
ncbi:MAG: hypothetical protein K5739_03655 [Lachnospiraceae bacterium]|nr:hypothetical protein [Lachnospiraceae bacterium]